jgi:hypothetical protein
MPSQYGDWGDEQEWEEDEQEQAWEEDEQGQQDDALGEDLQ